MIEQFIVLIAALIANTFSALAGGGAGLIQFPVLLFLGLPFSIALATHKVASVALGIGASVRYFKEDLVQRKFALFMLMVGLPAVILGSFAAIEIPDVFAKVALGLLTMSLGMYSIFQTQLGQTYAPQHRDKSGFITGGLLLFLIGFLNGSIASGTGLFATILLVKWFGMDYKRAVAYTLVVVGLFWNGVGGVTLAIISQVKWAWIPALLLGSFVGGYLGAHLAILKGNLWIKRGYEIVTILVGLNLLF
ncbi:MAG: sulfite exporter TauE/SafE family protein [Methylococcales bacterium]|nr:sulfite exporter TauE/SafE family protein [Methylococcales bacterium]